MEIAINPIQVKFGDGRSTLSTPFADNRNALNSPETTVTTTDLKEDFQSEPVSSRRQLEDNYEKFLKTQQQQKERKNYVAVKEIFIEDSSKRGVNQRASIKKMGQDVSGKHDGKYFEIPHVLDGFFMLNRAPAEDPEDVHSLDISGKELKKVIENDLELFVNLHTVRAGDNSLELESLGNIPFLKSLYLPLNGVSNIQFTAALKFPALEYLDLSYNSVTSDSLLILAALPNLVHLDLTSNSLNQIANHVSDMRVWWKENLGNDFLLKDTRSRVASKDPSSFNHSRSLSLALSEAGRSNRGAATPDPLSRDRSRAMTAMSNTTTNLQRIMTCEFQLPGFIHLETLILEDNYFSGKEVFDVLGGLPSLKMLNLSNNRIKSLAFLREGSPKNIDDSDPNASLLEMNEEEVAAGHDEHHIKSDSNIATAAAVASAASKDKLGSKELGTSVKGTKTSSETSNKRIVNKNAPRSYNGFTKLEELRLVKNLIEDYDGLLGIVALPVLQRVFLEGNPILKTKTSAVPLTAPTTSSDSDILNMLPNEYGIQVCDVIYQSIRLNTVDYNLLDPKALKSGSYQDKNLSGKSKRGYTFISKKPAGAILAQVVKKKQLKHSVEPFQESKANLRRDFKYGEEDVNRMIQMGRIYTLKELEELMGSQESLGTDGSGETSSQASADANDPSFLTGLTLAEIGDEKILEESSSDNDANGATAGGGKTNGVYDPFAFDETFITGVHITDSTYGSSEKGKGESWMDEWEDMDSSDENESDSASTAANLPILPSTIQLSIRALRHAMYNPVSYERVQEASYAQPTFAYRRKLRSVGPRFNLPRYEVGLRQTGGYYDHQNVITNTPRWEIGKKKSMLPPLYSSSTAATGTGTWGNSMGYGGGYQHRAANEFEEMSNMMNQVDERLNVIEANLSTVLGDQQLRKRLPLTKSLLNEVRRVYDRIEKEYTEEAYEKLHQEELEKSATAFELLLQQTKIKQ